ncbi:Nin1 binding protein [Scheffersomyces spartinae]|uniref:20S-pre-rRNA D-site endonuclease NOB1 n=1 Tax=Scheffersomyces spartinae TaxID=45513 RepID=A0A9P7V885_9ASCO|nr:Nin1 binding protein [Scheffersomyces spartinae]KAG7193036.1 Nin1 binding protein [Scheffersomyces spartinae]
MSKSIQSLVLDAGPLITQTSSQLQQFANTFYTTPGVHSELKDEHSRQQLILWGDKLQVRHPKQEYIDQVSRFARLTGDYAVLSANDIHIIALAYELEVELNHGDWRLRKFPGEKLEFKTKATTTEVTKEKSDATPVEVASETLAPTEQPFEEVKAKKPRRRGGKRQREKREAQLQNELVGEKQQDTKNTENTEESETTILQTKEVLTQAIEKKKEENYEALEEDYGNDDDDDDDDDDGDWINPENLYEEMMKDNNEQIAESKVGEANVPFIKCALTTGDFACQNVAMQIGLNLMNSMSGRQIRRVRNYMYRCHACFRMTPIPKNGKPKHFCPKCGGQTLLRCAVSIDNITGKVTPHLKANFNWIRRGDRYTLPSPLSKNSQKRQGNAGHQHNKQNRHRILQDPVLLREDQKEYVQALKDDDWQRRQNEKALQEWIGGGSADNFISPFTTGPTVRGSGVRVGRSRFINSSKGRK